MAKRRQASKGEAYWRRIVRQQAASGGAIRDFCRRNKLRESTFYFWRRELQRRDEAAQRRPGGGRSPAHTTFVPVSVAAEAAEAPASEDPPGIPAGRIEIVLPAGHRIGLTPPVDRQALANVLAVLSLDRDAALGQARPSLAEAPEAQPC